MPIELMMFGLPERPNGFYQRSVSNIIQIEQNVKQVYVIGDKLWLDVFVAFEVGLLNQKNVSL